MLTSEIKRSGLTISTIFVKILLKEYSHCLREWLKSTIKKFKLKKFLIEI